MFIFLPGLFALATLVLAHDTSKGAELVSYAHRRIAKAIAANNTAPGRDGLATRSHDGPKYVFMHHIVGNTYAYTKDDWIKDIQEIEAKDVDAIALNIGSSDWQRSKIQLAYDAAQSLNSKLKLFLSFDFTEMPCDESDTVNRVNLYANHPNQFRVNGGPMISTYSGACFGNDGWARIKQKTNGYLMPFIWGLEGNFQNWLALDSWYCWGCAWPQGNYAKNTDDDNYYLSQLGSRFATTISVWFYTHYNYKNIYLRGDDWLINSRWEQLIALRSQLTYVELVTWNDYGESDYFGPIRGLQPDGTTWATNFPHTAWFDMSAYYIAAFKTGVYPAITLDVIYFWSRPHPSGATASSDPLPSPEGASWSKDLLWAVVFATANAQVTLTCGSSTQTFDVIPGVNKISIPLAEGRVTVQMVRNNQVIINKTPSDFSVTNSPQLYNYNAYVGSASAIGGSIVPTSSSASTTASATSTSVIPSSTGTGSWSYVGCYVDPSSPRVLSTQVSSEGSTQSNARCLASCASRGFAYGGTEYSIECWCGASITSGSSAAPESDCSMKCSGAAGEQCGGPNKLSLYKSNGSATTTPTPSVPSTTSTSTSTSSSATPTGWNFLGCYVDPSSSRVLPTQASSLSTQSVSGCLALCGSRGFAYGGTEYGIECWCGANIASGSSVGSSSECNMQCSGGSGICGGGNRLSLYSTNAPTNPPATTGVPSGWKYSGCYVDPGTARVLKNMVSSKDTQTISSCLQSCQSLGYSYGGGEYARECWCDSSLAPQATTAPESDCKTPCSGDKSSSLTCGDGGRISLYKRG